MLAGAGSAHGQGALDEAVGEGLGGGELLIVGEAEDVEVSVADMADDNGGVGLAVQLGTGLDDALGEAGDGDADVRDGDAGAGAEGAGGEVGVVAGVPEALALGRTGLGFKAEAAVGEAEFLGHGGGFSDLADADAMELKEEGGALGKGELGVAVDGLDLVVVKEFDAGGMDAELDDLNDGVDRRLDGGESGDGDGDGFRLGVEAEGDLSDDAEGAFSADEEAGEVVTGGGFAGAGAGVDDASVGEDDGEGEDVFTHGAIADGSGSAGGGGGHAAEGGVCAGVDEEGEAGVVEGFLELGAGDAGFDGGIHVFRADAEDAVHAHHVKADAAMDGLEVAFKGGSGAEGDDGEAMGGGDADDGGNFAGGLGEADEIGRGGGEGVFAVAVVVADGLGRGDTILEEELEFGEGLVDGCGGGSGGALLGGDFHFALPADVNLRRGCRVGMGGRRLGPLAGGRG